ncbi:MAG: hypothetical protein ACRC6N_05440 [Plesiomonas sp.]
MERKSRGVLPNIHHCDENNNAVQPLGCTAWAFLPINRYYAYRRQFRQ